MKIQDLLKLKDCLDLFGAKKSFALSFKSDGKILCSRAGYNNGQKRFGYNVRELTNVLQF